jgi:hypothetical protein
MRSKEEQEQIVKRALSESIETEFVDPTEGRIIAVEISSTVLEAHIWLAFDDSFNPGDGLAIFYPDELQFLKDKGSQTLRKIHGAKLKLGNGGGRVVQ